MKALVNKKSIIIASSAILIAVISIVSVNVWDTGGPVTGLANTVSRPIRVLASQVARTFEAIYSSIYRYDALMVDYERLARRVVELETDYRDASALRDQNESLRALLGFRERHTGYRHEMATVVSRGGSNWSSIFTINRGYANSAIERGNGVATEYGVLIGQVAEVSATTSTVITILDTTFSAGAFVGDGGGTATVKGDFNFMSSGLLILDHLDDGLRVLPGDTVVTSGIGGVLPAWLFVGEVVEVRRHITGIGRYATVRPLLELDTISQVFVIIDFEITD
jgi:rod shape-determining protein MreC